MTISIMTIGILFAVFGVILPGWGLKQILSARGMHFRSDALERARRGAAAPGARTGAKAAAKAAPRTAPRNVSKTAAKAPRAAPGKAAAPH